MKAGDVSGGHAFSRESWLSTPLSDPNAALWASITPPANPTLATLVRRRAGAFSLDLLAQRLFLHLPSLFSSRSSARTAILAATVAFGAALGTAGYLAVAPRQSPSATSVEANEANEAYVASGDTPVAPSPPRQGHTEVAAPILRPAPVSTTRWEAPAPANVNGSQPSASAADGRRTVAKAKRVSSKKRSKATARRAYSRRTRAMAD